ncbi:hypothetical protein DL98DRAFT_5316 [Cadophora sp. DSE1049]|nr:hypothetical protein DL98DRAFT_5316 [Cadophora sp. DSE1049]
MFVSDICSSSSRAFLLSVTKPMSISPTSSRFQPRQPSLFLCNTFLCIRNPWGYIMLYTSTTILCLAQQLITNTPRRGRHSDEPCHFSNERICHLSLSSQGIRDMALL